MRPEDLRNHFGDLYFCGTRTTWFWSTLCFLILSSSTLGCQNCNRLRVQLHRPRAAPFRNRSQKSRRPRKKKQLFAIYRRKPARIFVLRCQLNGFHLPGSKYARVFAFRAVTSADWRFQRKIGLLDL